MGVGFHKNSYKAKVPIIPRIGAILLTVILIILYEIPRHGDDIVRWIMVACFIWIGFSVQMINSNIAALARKHWEDTTREPLDSDD